MSHLPPAAPAATRACDQILGGGQLAHMHVSACWAVAHVSCINVASMAVGSWARRLVGLARFVGSWAREARTLVGLVRLVGLTRVVGSWALGNAQFGVGHRFVSQCFQCGVDQCLSTWGCQMRRCSPLHVAVF